MSILSLIPLWFVLALLIPVALAVTGAYRRAKGPRSVLCPRAGGPAVIALNQQDAAFMHVLGNRPRKLDFCSRWPEVPECGQECLRRE